MSPDIPPEAEVIRLAREATGMTAQSAAEASRAHDGKGVSAAYWRDVERGYGGRRGQRVPTRASARALAAMARVVGVRPAQLTGAGREDAARVLEEILRRGSLSPVAVSRPAADPYPFGKPSEAMARDLSALDSLQSRLQRYVDEHPGEVRGSDIFPLDPYRQEAWDSLVTRFKGNLQLVIGGFVVWMAIDAQEEAERRRQGGTAAGLMRNWFAGHAVRSHSP